MTTAFRSETSTRSGTGPHASAADSLEARSGNYKSAYHEVERQKMPSSTSDQLAPIVNHVSATVRGERLYPSRSSRIYWHLTCLRMQMEQVIETYVSSQSGASLVDYGCGNMPYRSLFQPLVSKYTGIDLPGNVMADVIAEDPNRTPLDAQSVDILLSSQVLEHVADPPRYLQEAQRLLKPEGILILSTHGSWPYHPDPHDFWRWTSEGLKKTITEAGFEIVHFRGVMGPASSALQLWQDAVYFRMRGFFRKPFTRFLQFLIRKADRACADEARDRDASVYVVVAKKIG